MPLLYKEVDGKISDVKIKIRLTDDEISKIKTWATDGSVTGGDLESCNAFLSLTGEHYKIVATGYATGGYKQPDYDMVKYGWAEYYYHPEWKAWYPDDDLVVDFIVDPVSKENIYLSGLDSAKEIKILLYNEGERNDDAGRKQLNYPMIDRILWARENFDSFSKMSKENISPMIKEIPLTNSDINHNRLLIEENHWYDKTH
ncbi:hypothetical protein GAP52_003 [Cronobacter phage vB_CsaP_GAP52]|uniref:Uncharacterized protein n=1 Tax=Cronobacter phage vB_CsaP_GAP52 TaxID=1141137 RepID=K4F9S0_9CAUD|nr:hypothetical protein D858_gp114 [Cronobacter phage vB_CsaP_GAP52]AFC21995.1 hypothetical protein GAP52_003 [Cronobacter phage vB_CsaP_GAP52]